MKSEKSDLTNLEKLKYRLLISLPGMRILKTVLGVLIVSVIFHFVDNWSPVYAALAVIVCTGEDMQTSWSKSISRLKGTAFAGFYAYLILTLLQLFEITSGSLIYILLIVLLLIPLMQILVALNSGSSVAIACIVYSVICFGAYKDNPLQYAIVRTLTTMTGILVALFINWLPILNKLGKKLRHVHEEAAENLDVES